MSKARFAGAALAGLLLLAGAGAAQATIHINDTFDGENGGGSQLNYTGFANWTVGGGSVDLIREPAFGLDCRGPTSSCVDLDGSTGDAGALTSKLSYSFDAGDTVNLNFYARGNGRGAGPDTLFSGFLFDAPTDIHGYTIGAYGDVDRGDFFGLTTFTFADAIGADEDYTLYVVAFKALSAGTVRVIIGAEGTDNMGPLLDDVRFDINKPTNPGGIPEPSTWAMMLLGFGGLGAMLRRRRAVYA